MAVCSLLLLVAVLSASRPISSGPVLNGTVTRHLRLHTSVANQFDVRRDGVSIRTAARSPQWAQLRMPSDHQPTPTNEANATSAVNSVLSQIVKSSMSDMLQKLIKSVQEVLQRFMRDPDTRLPAFLQVNQSENVNSSDFSERSENKTSVSEDQFWALVFQRMMNESETNATTSPPSASSTTDDVSILWDSGPSQSNSTLSLSFADEAEQESEDSESLAFETYQEVENRTVLQKKPASVELQVPPTPTHLENITNADDFDASLLNELRDVEADDKSDGDHQETDLRSANRFLSRTLPPTTYVPTTTPSSTPSTTLSSSTHFSTKIASGNPFELVIRVETKEGQSQVKVKEQKSANIIMPSTSTRRPPIPTSINTLITGEPFNMEEKVRLNGRPPESNIVVADWLSPSDPPSSYSTSSSATSLLSTVLIGVSAGFIIFIVASFGLMYACYGCGADRDSRHKGDRLFCGGGGGSINFESGSCADHRQSSPRDFGAALVGPAPLPRRFLTRLNPCKPFYYQSSGSEHDGASSVANDRHMESTWTQASVLSDAMPTFDTTDSGNINPAADLSDSVVF